MRTQTLSVVVLATICGLAAAGHYPYRQPKHLQTRYYHQKVAKDQARMASAATSYAMTTKYTNAPKNVEPQRKSYNGLVEKSMEEKAMEKNMEKQMEKSMEKHMEKPMEKHKQKPMVKEMEKQMEKQMEKSIEKPMMKQMEKQMAKHMEKPMEKHMALQHMLKHEKRHSDHSFEDHYDLEHHFHDFHAHPKYKFGYGVKDHKSGDDKTHWEERDGDKVKGSYTIKDADGTTRIVEYTADHHNGFQAVVKTIPAEMKEEKSEDEGKADGEGGEGSEGGEGGDGGESDGGEGEGGEGGEGGSERY